MDDLVDKVAVVTGGASGIGFALACAFADAGCRVVVADIEAAALDEARGKLEAGAAGRVHAVLADVADLSSVEALAAATLDRFGGVDILCNNAGVSTFTTIDRLSIGDWQWVLGVDLWGPIHGVHTFLPIMRRQGTPGHVVNTASTAGLMSGIAYLAPYAVAKVGVVSLSESLRAELAAAGAPIGVSVLCPGYTTTRVIDSDRNRPAELGVEATTDDGTAFRDLLRAGLAGDTAKQPAELAAMVLDAIHHDRFWVITDEDVRLVLDRRFAAILDAVPRRE
ncbi:MAG TPA: SDR family NAD(P)-dependent oxidoreductase [Acidimicrobiia bacterium]|nr:SDR family NAD(P)-dependent oxidoreductase [Acidimicrobiia bacterium]